MGQRKEIKEILETILGTTIHFTTDTVDEEIKVKGEFMRIIGLFEEAWTRQNKLYEQFRIDTTTMDDIYFQVIESLIHFCFDPIAAEAVLFYVYTRLDLEGEVLAFIDDKGEEHIFNSKEDLWEYLVDLKVRLDNAKG